MKRYLLAVLLFAGVQTLTYAQDAKSDTVQTKTKGGREVEVPGIVITLRGDTIPGTFYEKRTLFGLDGDYLEMPHPDIYYAYVWFTPDKPFMPDEVKRSVQNPDKPMQRTQYTPAEIQGFRLSSSEFIYLTLKTGKRKKDVIFARPIEAGSIALYSRRMPSTRMPQTFFLKKDETVIAVKSGDKPEKVASLFQDDPATYAAVLKGDYTYTYESLIMLVRAYNASGIKQDKLEVK